MRPSSLEAFGPCFYTACFELNSNAMYRLPQLAADNFLYVRFPKTNFAYIAAPTPVFGQFPPLSFHGSAVQPNAISRGRSALRSHSRNRAADRTRVRHLSADIDRPRAPNWSTHTPAAILAGGYFEPVLSFFFFDGSNLA